MKLDETKLQRSVSFWMLRKGHVIAIPNVDWSWLYWEADLITVTKARYMHEFEIKISAQDFKADFKKRKHQTLKNGNIKNNRVPNYFTYVAPLKAIPICIPDHAGLILISPTNRYGHEYQLDVIKKAPLIHRNKQTDASMFKMLRTLMFKYWNLAQTLHTIKIQKELFK